MNYFINTEGLVICSFSKDYEIQSWNEHGEILKKEGILTVAYSFIFSNAYIGRRKELYLIIRIPYIVIMTSEEETESKNAELQSVNSLRATNEHDKEIGELKSRIANLEDELRRIDVINKDKSKEIRELKKENLRLKIVSGEAKSGWRKDRNMIERDDPITGKLEFYNCPVHFNYYRVSKLKYLDEHRLKVRFYHNGDMIYDKGYFTMVTDAYLWLCGKLPEQQERKKQKELNIHSINSITEMKKYIHFIDSQAKTGRMYFNRMCNFLLTNRESKFKFDYLQTQIKFKGKQSGYDLLHDFEKWDFLKKGKQGYYHVIF